MSRRSYNFELALDVDASEDEFLDDVADRLIERGCDDATFSVRYGVPHVEFRRRAGGFIQALLSAIGDLESEPGVRVARVELDELLTATEIAQRTGRSRQSIQQLIAQERGPGDFPEPADWIHGARLWPWPMVAQWFRQALGRKDLPVRSPEEAAFVRALNGLLEARLYVPRLGSQERRVISTYLEWELRAVAAGEDAATRQPPPAAAALAELGENADARPT